MVATYKGCGSPVLTGGRRMVSYDGSRTVGQGTSLKSTLMESGMDMSSGMVLLVMCGWKRTG